ncbi:MAG TPA: recombinase family protein, partial [Streptosporangiaceae bacterium]|nr:recombinase family protein [Streptosporangiaceae bacterium]
GAYYGGMETLRAKRESAVKSARVREAADRNARAGKRPGGGWRWFGYTRIYVNPDEPDHRKRIILREEINPTEAEALQEAARRVLAGETIGSVIRDWDKRGIRPVAASEWSPSSLIYTLKSARIAGFREWQGTKYPTTDWPAIIDTDTHERLVKLFADPARRRYSVRRMPHLLSGIATCPKCGKGLHYRRWSERQTARADSYACVKGPGGGCGGVGVKAELLEEYVTGAVLDALESPRVQDALREGHEDAPRRAELLAEISDAQETRAEARRDYAEKVIDRADWLDIRDRTEARITKARREYDRLSGSGPVLGDIPPAERVRDVWESWSVDRRRAAIRAVLHAVKVKNLPPGVASNPGAALKDPAKRREREMATLRTRVDFDWRV